MKNKQMTINFWWLDLPIYYFQHLSDMGLLLGHIEDHPDIQPFSGKWEQYTDDSIEGIVHTELSLCSLDKDIKTIKIPKGEGRYYCFTDFCDYPGLAAYPSIFEASKRIVCYCHCTSNWDGLLNSSIVTIDVDSEKFFNQYWEDKWLDRMRKEIPSIGEDVDMWSNGGFQLYLDMEETKLLIHGDYFGDHAASLIFEWDICRWDLLAIIPGPYPKSDSNFDNFRIGANSLTRRFTGR